MIQRRNAVFVVTDQNLIAPAQALWRRLLRLNTHSDTDVIIVSPSRPDTGFDPRAKHLHTAELGLPNVRLEGAGHITAASYYRLCVPRLLSSIYRRALYLDIDVIPMGPELFDVLDADLHGAPLAAARDHTTGFAPYLLGDDGLVHDGRFAYERYFNSGVMLIDIDRYVADEIEQKAFAALSTYGSKSFVFLDQSVLNFVLRDRWAELSPAMNMAPCEVGTIVSELFSPRVIHYYGSQKLWHSPTPFYRLKGRRAALLAIARENGGIKFLLGKTNPVAIARHFVKVGVLRRPDHLYVRPPYLMPDNDRLMQYLTETTFVDQQRPANSNMGV